jgi:hypothetical protein
MSAPAPAVARDEGVAARESVSAGTASRTSRGTAGPSPAFTAAGSAAARVSTLLTPRPQPTLRVSSPDEPAEREAEAAARAVMRMTVAPPTAPPPGSPNRGRGRASATPAAALRHASSLLRVRAAPAPVGAPAVHRQAAGEPRAGPTTQREIEASAGGGQPLPPEVRGFMEPRFRADFAGVRVHTDEKAGRLASRLSARAFTYGRDIFFGRGEYRPAERDGAELIAHELTHTIQQRRVVQRQAAPVVAERAPTGVQRLGIRDALNFFADAANAIPGYRMFTIVLGVNPINMSRVERSAANIMRAVVEFIPGGNLITRALDSYGVFERVGGWVEEQIRSAGVTGSAIRQSLMDFLDSLRWRDIFRLGSVWNRAKRIFTEPIGRLISLAKGLITGILGFLREAVLQPLARLAEGTRGWDLLKAVLGKDPITGEAVPRTADTLIGGFMKLIGQEEVWNNLKRANAVGRAWAWFQGALSGVLGFVRQVPGLIVSTIRSITIGDFLPITNLFAKVGRAFAGFLGSFFSWAGGQVMSLLQIIFEVVAPAVMPYVRRAAGAFRQIVQNPVGFIRNLVRAGILGFRQFGGNFLNHLRRSLIGWLTGAMSGAGVYVPRAFSLQEIVKFVLSVLGLTWQSIRQRLARVVGEGPVRAMETGFDIVRTLVTQGPAAAWNQIVQGLTNLREMVMEQVMSFVRARVVQAAIARLVTSLNPAGAFIQAIIAIYNTVMFFVERLRQIAQVAMSFVDSIAAIASGAVGSAANRVEQTMGGLLTLVISFLARIAGLGRVSDAVIRIVNRVRQPINRALDRVANWIVTQARRLGRFVAQAGVPQDPRARLRLAGQAAVAAARRLRGRITGALLNPVLAAIRTRFGLTEIRPYERGGKWWVRMVANPVVEQEIADAGGPAVSAGTGAPATAPGGWPVAQGAKISLRFRRSRTIETVLAVAPDRITYTERGGTTVSMRVSFMNRWSIGDIRPGGQSAAELRAYLTERWGAPVANAILSRGGLATNLGLVDKSQAHHIIPVEIIGKQGILRLLIESGWDFNDAANGVPLAAGFHGNHPAYTAYVNRRIDAFMAGQTGRSIAQAVTPFRTFLRETLIPELRELTDRAKQEYSRTGRNLNAFFTALG